MLKITRLLNVSRLEVRNGDSRVVRFGIGSGSEEFAKKSRKLKGQKLSKFQKSSMSEKL